MIRQGKFTWGKHSPCRFDFLSTWSKTSSM